VSLAITGHEAGVGAGKIGAALPPDDLPVNPNVVREHFQAFLQRVARDLPVLDVFAIRKGNPIGQGPRIALADDGAKLIGDREALLVRGDDGRESFPANSCQKWSRKFLIALLMLP